ncbi:MAG: hypothetical protein BAA02_10090 [Paenibacillaceae bacterium ZCTH02-B3]|nr:MAG: hypothetical protein BAA02_10090 [Paenibacillaceae bacterium ZCTH02-B3]
MTGVTIAEAEAADLPVILRLRHEAFQSEAEIYRMAIPPLRQPHDIMVILLEPPPENRGIVGKAACDIDPGFKIDVGMRKGNRQGGMIVANTKEIPLVDGYFLVGDPDGRLRRRKPLFAK